MDFVDCNMGCPIDLICNKGAGSALLQERNQGRMKKIVRSMSQCLSVPLTIKIRKGYLDNKDLAHRDIVPVVGLAVGHTSSFLYRSLSLCKGMPCQGC